MIQPTNGRVVWVHMTAEQVKHLLTLAPHPLADIAYTPGGQPMAATICYVHNDRMGNVRVVDYNGNAFALTSCLLLQDDDTPGGAGYWAEWMPYQKGQAAKTEELERASAT